MSSQSKYIPMTIRLDNELYQRFRDKVNERGATRVGVIRLLIREFVSDRKSGRRGGTVA